MASSDAEKGVARLLVLLKSHLLGEKKIRFNKYLDKKDQELLKVKIGCVTVRLLYITSVLSKVLCWPNKSYSYDLYLLCP